MLDLQKLLKSTIEELQALKTIKPVTTDHALLIEILKKRRHKQGVLELQEAKADDKMQPVSFYNDRKAI
jgi:hypothetical protein